MHLFEIRVLSRRFKKKEQILNHMLFSSYSFTANIYINFSLNKKKITIKDQQWNGFKTHRQMK